MNDAMARQFFAQSLLDHLANLAIVRNRRHQNLAVGRSTDRGTVDRLQPGRRRTCRQASQYQYTQPAVKWLHPALHLLSLSERLLSSDLRRCCTLDPSPCAKA